MTATASTRSERLTELAGSPWDENLLRHFSEHVDGERELLEAYGEFRDSGPEHVRYLVGLILEDEARHHRLFRELANRFKSDIDWKDYGPKAPYVEKASADRAPLLEATRRFLAFEHEDEKSLERLQKELRPVRDTTLFSLLVELMQLDTKKHIAILNFVRRQAEKTISLDQCGPGRFAALGPIDTGPLVPVERPVPVPGAGEIQVKVAVCGVCRNDLHLAEGDLVPRRTGIVPGHELGAARRPPPGDDTTLRVGQG